MKPSLVNKLDESLSELPLKHDENSSIRLSVRGSIGARLHIPKRSPFSSTLQKSRESLDSVDSIENQIKNDTQEEEEEEETKLNESINPNTLKMEVLKYRTSSSRFKPSENMKIDSSRVKIDRDIEFIKKSMKQHFIFYNISTSEMQVIAEKMCYFTTKKDEFVFKQGDNALHFFIIEKGEVEVYINEQLRRTLISSEGFGELALLYNAPRSASIKATIDCGFWAIDRETFKEAIKDIMDRQFEENYKFIKECPLFEHVTQQQKEILARFAILSRYTKGQNVFIEGDLATSFDIITEGSAIGFKEFKEVQKLVKGDYFGEEALFDDSPTRIMTIKAITPVLKCITMSRDALQNLLGSELLLIIYRNLQKSALLKSPLFSKLTDLQVEKVADAMEICNFSDGEIVFPKGVSTTAMVIILLEGSLKKKSTGVIVVNSLTTWWPL